MRRFSGQAGNDHIALNNSIVVADATAAHEGFSYKGARHSAETAHELAFAHLHQEFAEILTADQVLDSD